MRWKRSLDGCWKVYRKEKLKAEIKSAEETAKVMKIAMKSMNRYISSYEVGMGIKNKVIFFNVFFICILQNQYKYIEIVMY